MKKSLILLLCSLPVIIISMAAINSSNGKAGATGSPGETTSCTECHSGTINSGPGSVSISTNIPGNVYALGQTYQISVTVAHTGLGLFGLDVEALFTSDTTAAGTFVITNSAETKLLNATVMGDVRSNVVHKYNGGVAASTKTFNFNWTAPATDLGAVTFYVAGLACNSDAGASGDYTYTTTLVIQSPSSAGIENIISQDAFTSYYNAANNSIHLSMNVENIGRIQGYLYNMQGQKVCELFNETMSGKVERDFPVSPGLVCGIYFLRIESASNAITRKLYIK